MQKKTVKKALLASLFVVFYFFYISLVVKPQIESRFFTKELTQERQTVTNPNYNLRKIYENPQSEEIFPKPTGIPSLTYTPTPTLTPAVSSPTATNVPSPTPTDIVFTTTTVPTATFTPTVTPTIELSSTPTSTPTSGITSCDGVSFSQETSGSETIITVSGAWWLSVRANPNYSSVDFDEGNKIIKLHFTGDSGTVNIHTSGWEGAPTCKTYNWTK